MKFYSYRDKTGGITFGDFMEFLSVISKGTIKDKLMWTFTFYDVDHDGVISRDEMLKVTNMINSLIQKNNKIHEIDKNVICFIPAVT